MKTYSVDEIFGLSPTKPVRPARRAKTATKPVAPTPESHPMGKLMGIRNAANYLNEMFDGGYSECLIRARIKSGEWQYRSEWRKTGKIYKIDIDAVIRWQQRQ